MNPIVELAVRDRKYQNNIEKIMKEAGYFLMIKGIATQVWVLNRYAKCVEGEKDV